MSKFGSRPTRDENVMMIDLMVLSSAMHQHADSIRERISEYPNAWRDVRLLTTLVKRLESMLFNAMDKRDQHHYMQLASYGQMRVSIPGPIEDKTNMLVERSDIDAIVGSAMTGECALCIKEGREIKRCRLREALVNISPPKEYTADRPRAICEWREKAIDVLEDKDVII